MSRQYFGTDGVRGHVGKSPIVPEFGMRLGHAAAGVQQMVSRDLDFRGRGPAAGV